MTGPPPDRAGGGAWMHGLCAELHPICRSITGDGVRTTLAAVARHLPLDVHEVPSGTPVLDWTVPPEWTVREAYLADASGRPQWLTGLYRTDALRAAAATIPDAGRNASVRSLLGGLAITAVAASDDVAFDIDTWDDLNEARRRSP